MATVAIDQWSSLFFKGEPHCQTRSRKTSPAQKKCVHILNSTFHNKITPTATRVCVFTSVLGSTEADNAGRWLCSYCICSCSNESYHSRWALVSLFLGFLLVMLMVEKVDSRVCAHKQKKDDHFLHKGQWERAWDTKFQKWATPVSNSAWRMSLLCSSVTSLSRLARLGGQSRLKKV